MAKRKKSNNPFKMTGSWIGAVIGLIMIPYDIMAYNHPITSIFCDVSCEGTGGLGWSGWNCIASNCSIPNDFIPILIIIIGFFAGYGVQLLIRKMRKRK